MALTDKLTAIGNAIREKTGKTDLIPLDLMPVEIRGISGEEYNEFWNNYLATPFYNHLFSGGGWNDLTFRPPKDIEVKGGASMMFCASSITDLFGNLGITIDFSKATNITQIFAECNTVILGELNFTSAPNLTSAFYNAKELMHIEKIILKSNGTQTFSNAFGGCEKLQVVRFEGAIGKAISFAASPLLTNESVESIISALLDLTGATAQTLTLHADVAAKLTDTQKATITAKNWTLVS